MRQRCQLCPSSSLYELTRKYTPCRTTATPNMKRDETCFTLCDYLKVSHGPLLSVQGRSASHVAVTEKHANFCPKHGGVCLGDRSLAARGSPFQRYLTISSAESRRQLCSGQVSAILPCHHGHRISPAAAIIPHSLTAQCPSRRPTTKSWANHSLRCFDAASLLACARPL